MSVTINHLSSEELFELAKLKQQQETEGRERTRALADLKERRKQLEFKHARALESIDTQISELHRKRAQVVIMHKAAVDAVDREVAELAREARNAEAAKAAAERVVRPTARRVPAESGLASVLGEIMKGRTSISETLLKEQLRVKGWDVGGFGKQLEQMVRERLLVSKGGGNYTLARKR